MSLLRRRMMMASSVKEPDVPDTPTEELDYLTIIPLHEEEVEYKIYPFGGNDEVDWNMYIQDMPFYYRINKGEWIEVNLQPSEDLVFRITLTKSKELQLKSMGCDFSWSYMVEIQMFKIFSEGEHNVSGTPMSLLYGDGFKENNYVTDEMMYCLFIHDKGLTKILNPKTFLPYTELGTYCYEGMFEDCVNLTNAPELPAITLAKGCYDRMFSGCSKLNYIKMLATDISATFCLNNWVYGVSPTGIFVKSKDATWDVTGVNGVPEGWTVITDDYPTNSEGMPDSKEFGFPLFLNTEYKTETDDVILRSRDVKDIIEPLASWFFQNTDGYGEIYSAVLYRDRIFIDGYIVTRMYYDQSRDSLMVETQKDYGNDSTIGFSSDGTLYVLIVKLQVGGGVEISFNVDGWYYTATKGMTWKQWVESSYYNPSYGELQIYVVGNTVYVYSDAGNWYLIGQNGDDVIIEDTRYELYGPVPAPEL